MFFFDFFKIQSVWLNGDKMTVKSNQRNVHGINDVAWKRKEL